MGLIFWPAVLRADDDDKPAAPSNSGLAADSRFGVFDWLDHRSAYYGDAFPEPFRVEDTTVDNELRLDWQHVQSRNGVDNQFLAEIQKAVGIVTFEIQATYAINHAEIEADDPARQDGFGSIELGGRVPIEQFYSQSAGIDNTIGLNLELGVATNSRISKNTEMASGVFDDLRLGEHITIQSLVGISSLLGSQPEEGRESLEYGIAFGYSIEDEDFAIPHVERFTPIFELVGETALGGQHPGRDDLSATAGARCEFKHIGSVQPSLGAAYLFPLDQGGRDEMRWGLIASLDFEF